MDFIMFIVIGIAVGWLAGVLVVGHGLGGLRDLVVGVFGSLLGGYLFQIFGIQVSGAWPAFGSALVGAIVFISILALFHRPSRSSSQTL